MKRIGRTTVVFLVLAALLALTALPVTASDDAETSGGAATEGVEGPAVEIAEDSPEESVADWTYRYMTPLTLVLAAVVMVGMSIRYFTKVVRRRYRIVEE